MDEAATNARAQKRVRDLKQREGKWQAHLPAGAVESVDDTFFIPHSKPEDGSLQARNSLVREGAPPIGELGVLSHLDSFVPSVPQSSVSSVCISAV